MLRKRVGDENKIIILETREKSRLGLNLVTCVVPNRPSCQNLRCFLNRLHGLNRLHLKTRLQLHEY